MSETPDRRRRYGDREIGVILKRAAEMQQEGAAPTAAEGGSLSLRDLEEVASEAGIDPRYIRAAAAEVDAGEWAEAGNALLGAPVTLRLERTVPREVTAADLDRLIPEIQHYSKGYGQGGTVGGSLRWATRDPSGGSTMEVMVTPRNGRTEIRIEERFGGLAGGLFGGVVGGGGLGAGLGIGLGVGLGALGSPAFAIAFPILILGGSYWLARSIYSTTVGRRRRDLRELLDRMTDVIEASGPLPAPDSEDTPQISP